MKTIIFIFFTALMALNVFIDPNMILVIMFITFPPIAIWYKDDIGKYKLIWILLFGWLYILYKSNL